MDTTTILAIDDSPEVLDTVSLILDEAGYHVVLAMEPDRALALCNEIKFDAVLCDLYLLEDLSIPNKASITTGMDVILRLRDKHPRVPIIAMSGNLAGTSLERLKKLGLSGTLSKPFTPSELLEVIEKAVRVPESSQGDSSKPH